jgi:phage host-nuclease inhibitor protein Gam
MKEHARKLETERDEYRAERDSESRWAATYKAERDALQSAVDAFCKALPSEEVHYRSKLYKLASREKAK